MRIRMTLKERKRERGGKTGREKKTGRQMGYREAREGKKRKWEGRKTQIGMTL